MQDAREGIQNVKCFSVWGYTRGKLQTYMNLGGGGRGGSLKYPLPPTKFLLKATLPQGHRKKMAFFKKFLTFLAKKCHFLKKIFWTSQDFHKSEVKISKVFLNPYPPPKIFGRAHV
jgi:hypothetical protein